MCSCERVDQIDARRLRRRAHSGRRLLLLRGALQLVHEALYDRRLLREVRAACEDEIEWNGLKCTGVEPNGMRSSTNVKYSSIGRYVNQEIKLGRARAFAEGSNR